MVGTADAYRELPPVIIRRIDKNEAELRQTMHYINGTRPANDWRGAYSLDRNPASGARLEQLNARKAFLEHQLAADRAALAEHEAQRVCAADPRDGPQGRPGVLGCDVGRRRSAARW